MYDDNFPQPVDSICVPSKRNRVNAEQKEMNDDTEEPVESIQVPDERSVEAEKIAETASTFKAKFEASVQSIHQVLANHSSSFHTSEAALDCFPGSRLAVSCITTACELEKEELELVKLACMLYDFPLGTSGHGLVVQLIALKAESAARDMSTSTTHLLEAVISFKAKAIELENVKLEKEQIRLQAELEQEQLETNRLEAKLEQKQLGKTRLEAELEQKQLEAIKLETELDSKLKAVGL